MGEFVRVKDMVKLGESKNLSRILKDLLHDK